jgi:hypothetical protein
MSRFVATLLLRRSTNGIAHVAPRSDGSDNQPVRNSVAWQWVISVILPAVAGFAGVLVGSWLTARREREQRRYSFMQRQLQELYSPLLGLRLEIRLRSELRNRMSSVADVEWKRLCEEVRQTADPIGGFERLQRDSWKYFEALIDYGNKQLAQELIPAYRRMLTIFRDNMWLAEPETRVFFTPLLEFVEVWERWLARSIPHEVVRALGHSESQLHPFYEHIEAKHDNCQRQLQNLKTHSKKAEGI